MTLRRLAVRVVACLLLTWAAADLFVPSLCSSEAPVEAAAGAPSTGEHDDCFCCCSHSDNPPLTVLVVSTAAPRLVASEPDAQLAAGALPRVYHPPLHA